MKIYISYSNHNAEVARAVNTRLNSEGIETWFFEVNVGPGDVIKNAIQEGIDTSDGLLILMSQPYHQSPWTEDELTRWLLRRTASREVAESVDVGIIPVKLDGSPVPPRLAGLYYTNAEGLEPHRQAEEAFDAVQTWARKRADATRVDARDWHQIQMSRVAYRRSESISRLRNALREGTLTLVLGAGVSIGAGIPSWNKLLVGLFANVFRASDPDGRPREHEQLAQRYHKAFAASPLIVAQYLRNALKEEYLPALQRELYRDEPEGGALLRVIAELCQAQRGRSEVQAVVTFNFDDLVERALSDVRVRHTPIFREGQRPKPDTLPVYHVHGFIPSEGDVRRHGDVVFAEEAYHDRFQDPFSWSNLTQLNHYTNSTCLFVGLSMTDPNLRRLLDVSRRKNPSGGPRHFIVQRRRQRGSLSDIPDDDRGTIEKLLEMAALLEEQDRINLGMNMLWVDEFDEIPGILRKIVE